MPESPEWKKLEVLVANIQRQLTPDAVVKHNEKIVGVSGRLRQLDVTVRQNVGVLKVLIAIECKHQKRPVSIEKVESFITKLRDVKAQMGVMVSEHGYDSGAIAVAKLNQITLYTLKEANNTDWQKLFTMNSVSIFRFHLTSDLIIATIDENNTVCEIAQDQTILDSEGAIIDAAYKILCEAWKASNPDILDEVTNISLEFPYEELYINKSSKKLKLKSISTNLTARVYRYQIPISLNEGSILSSPIEEKDIYKQMASNGIQWRQEIINMNGEEISFIQYKSEHQKSTSIYPLEEDTKEYIRLEITQRTLEE